MATILQQVDLCDEVEVEPASSLRVDGFAPDTLVRAALELLARRAGVEPRWRVRLSKSIPVSSGLGGGSSDAATALALANRTLSTPLEPAALEQLAATLGADVPFFLRRGPQLGTGDGSELRPLALPTEYAVLLLLPTGMTKRSTASVYEEFDLQSTATGYAERRRSLERALATVRRARDLSGLPPNDLASSPLAARLRELGAIRADVTGAGPAVYGLFEERRDAERAAAELRGAGRTWLASPYRPGSERG